MERISHLATDTYKLAMAIAGFPLRRETFVLALRKGGPWVMPVDPVAFVNSLLPDPTDLDPEWRVAHGMTVSGSYWEGIAAKPEITGVPKGAWFGNREPVLTVTAPSALASNLEARLIGELTFRIQVATLAKLHPHEIDQRLNMATCEREREIIQETLDAVGVKAPPILVDSVGYYEHILKRAKTLVGIVGDPSRVMEAGFRAVSCLDQHRLALQACKEGGFRATSNVLLARELGMIPAGTTGHEHTQRWGSDYEAFTAVRDMVPGDVTYLLDTFNTRHSGLPTALRVMLEDPSRACSVRFDSESTMRGDYLLATELFREHGLEPGLNLGGGFNFHKTAEFEKLRQDATLWPAAKQRYMYGQYLVEPHVPLPTRGDVGAVYKLSQTGSRPTMKFSDNPAKSSSPGRPVVFRLTHPGGSEFARLPLGIIGQEGEEPPEHYTRLVSDDPSYSPYGARREEWVARFNLTPSLNSPATQALVDQCEAQKAEVVRLALS